MHRLEVQAHKPSRDPAPANHDQRNHRTTRHMKHLIYLLTLLAALSAVIQPVRGDSFAQNRRLGRGVNIIGYDPLWRSPDQARFKEEHFRLLKEAGFHSVRVNLHPFRHMDREKNWALRDTWFTTLDWAVKEATAQGLMVILDFHEFDAMGKDPEANHGKFLTFWRQFSAHCANAGDNVVFEILNEPSKKLTPALWNEYLREALAVIREKNPTRTYNDSASISKRSIRLGCSTRSTARSTRIPSCILWCAGSSGAVSRNRSARRSCSPMLWIRAAQGD